MKKWRIIMLCFIMSLFLGACSKEDNKTQEKEQPKEQEKVSETPIDMADLQVMDMTINQEDQNNPIVVAKIKNHSGEALESIKFEYNVDGKTEYFLLFDGLKNNEISDIVSFQAPASLDLNDVVLHRISVSLKNKDKQYTHYTCKYEGEFSECSY